MKSIKLLLVLLTISVILKAQTNHRGKDDRPVAVFNTNVPDHQYDIISGRTTDQSVTLSVMFYLPASACVEYINPQGITMQTPSYTLEPRKPLEITLEHLLPDQRYRYRLIIENKKESNWYFFRTGRAFGDTFTFTLTADSHLDENSDISVYTKTLLNAAADSGDFHIDLGDTFMTDKYRNRFTDAYNQYLAQRYYFNLLKTPLFLVLGNHDGEQGGQRPEVVEWSEFQRNTFFPNPRNNPFYRTTSSFQNFFAWNWGNALFVVLDPFRYTSRAGNDDPWERTLGKEQYEWLSKTLSESKSKFKFVFIHNLVGAADIKGRARGGSEVAGLYEWGGKNPDGTNGFTTHRPDWEMPVHQLFVKYNVTAVFHGHDHIFANQTLDGIIYQCLSQPGAKEKGNIRNGEEYGYKNGTILNAPGYMRIKVTSGNVISEFVETDITDNSKNKSILFQFKTK